MSCRVLLLVLCCLQMSTLLAAPEPPAGADESARGRWLQAQLARLEPGATLALPAGRYRIDRPLVITTSDVTLRGAGAGETRIIADGLPPGSAVLAVRGEVAREAASHHGCFRLRENAPAGTSDLLVQDFPDLPPDTPLVLRAANDTVFFERLGSRKWRQEYPWLRWTMALLAEQSDDHIRLDRPLDTNLPTDARVCPLALVHGVTIADLTLQYAPQVHIDPDLYENVAPEREVDGIALTGTLGTRLERVRVIGAGRHPLVLDETLDVRGEDLALCGAINKGKEGNGYLRLARTWNAHLQRVEVRGLRHVAIQWSSANNLISDLDSDTGVDFHGGFSRQNLIRGRIVPRANFPFPVVRQTALDAHWAPPDGTGNRFTPQRSPAPSQVQCPAEPNPPAEESATSSDPSPS